MDLPCSGIYGHLDPAHPRFAAIPRVPSLAWWAPQGCIQTLVYSLMGPGFVAVFDQPCRVDVLTAATPNYYTNMPSLRIQRRRAPCPAGPAEVLLEWPPLPPGEPWCGSAFTGQRLHNGSAQASRASWWSLSELCRPPTRSSGTPPETTSENSASQ